MLNYLLQPNFQFVDINGKPLVGGWIEVYYTTILFHTSRRLTLTGLDNRSRLVLNSKGMAVVIADDANAYDVLCTEGMADCFGLQAMSRLARMRT